MILLIQIFLAHIIGDFFIQPTKWVLDKEQKKWRSVFLYLHAAVHFSLIIAITGTISFWRPALIIAVLHLLIDGTKLQFQQPGNRREWFFIDQALHMLTIVAVWSCAENMKFNIGILSDQNVLTVTTAVLFLWQPTSFIIKTIVSKWTPDANTVSSDSLESAGKLIGIIERWLVFIFILLGKWEGVGFLLAAKSIFRFGDLKNAKDIKLTEYVLIGTLLSFGIALITALIVLYLLGNSRHITEK